jgi:16S rRNA (guanine527-N7)-methyltransferase
MEQRQRLGQYLDLLLEANQTMNLTRITDRAKAEVLHIDDSLTLLPHLPAGKIRIADVGSGGGSPGIPLAIARPDAMVTCIEATKKKAVFLQKAVAELALQNVRILPHRAEDVGRGDLRQSFDVAVARAVGTMVWVAEWLLPLVKTGGKVLAMKGIKAGEEMASARRVIERLGGGAVIVHPAALPGADGHVIVEIRKARPTPPAFPRPASAAKGVPLR